MARKNNTTEQIIIKLREVELSCSQGRTIVEAVRQAEILIHRWVKYYNEVRPHSRLGGRPPAQQCVIPLTAS